MIFNAKLLCSKMVIYSGYSEHSMPKTLLSKRALNVKEFPSFWSVLLGSLQEKIFSSRLTAFYSLGLMQITCYENQAAFSMRNRSEPLSPFPY